MAQNAKSLDGVLVKKAHTRTRYTEKEVQELTDAKVKIVDELLAGKEKDIMTV